MKPKTLSKFWLNWMRKHNYSDEDVEEWDGKSWICPECDATETYKVSEEDITAILCPYCHMRREYSIMLPQITNKVKV